MRRVAILGFLLLAGGSLPARSMTSCTPGPYIVFFDHDSSAIKKAAVEVLDEAIERQSDCGSMQVMLEGHSDTSESPQFAGARARAVSNYFASRGIFVKPSLVVASGAKRLRVMTPPNTEERQNRRVEITYAPS